jgi:hypothetical protein
MMQRIFKTDYENLVHVYLYGQSIVEFISKYANVAMNVLETEGKLLLFCKRQITLPLALFRWLVVNLLLVNSGKIDLQFKTAVSLLTQVQN